MSLPNTHFGAEKIAEILRHCRAVFFIGVGGISMSSLAEITVTDGLAVGGSDRTMTPLTDRLQTLGVRVYPEGGSPDGLAGYDAAVYTVAIGADNPEYLAAQKRGIPLISRADYLGYLMMRFRTRVGVAGMHGKSTTTAMCARIYLENGDPTVLCGANLPELGNATCRVGKSREQFLFEACEYMDSFLDFSPTVAVVLNIGMDHVDYFHSMEQIRESFRNYAARTGEGGLLIINADDAECVRTFAEYHEKKLTFGMKNPADFEAREIRYEGGKTVFAFYRNGLRETEVVLPKTGEHNVSDALAAMAAAVATGIAPASAASALATFTGASRRMERKGVLPSGAVVYDDYGHHPDEIRATLAGARQMGFRRVLCAFQPHTYSRTAGLFPEFAASFADADRVFLVDIYAAREVNTFGVSSEKLAQAIGTRAAYTGGFCETAQAIAREARDGDLVIIIGAGDIFKTFEYLDLQ